MRPGRAYALQPDVETQSGIMKHSARLLTEIKNGLQFRGLSYGQSWHEDETPICLS